MKERKGTCCKCWMEEYMMSVSGGDVDGSLTLVSSVAVAHEGAERKPKRFRLLSSRSGSRGEPPPESPPSPRSPPSEPHPSSVTERFVPPELSIWDYFIAKVPPLFIHTYLVSYSPSYFNNLLF